MINIKEAKFAKNAPPYKVKSKAVNLFRITVPTLSIPFAHCPAMLAVNS